MDECTVQGRNSNEYALNQQPKLLQPRLSCKMFFQLSSLLEANRQFCKFHFISINSSYFLWIPMECFQPWKFLEFVTLLISLRSLPVLFRNLSNNGAKDTTGSIQQLAASVPGKRLAFWHNTGNQWTVSKESGIQQVRERQERASSVRCTGQIFIIQYTWLHRDEGSGGMCGSV